MKNVGFMRYLRQEWNKEKRATFGSTFIPFQSVELSLPRLLLSRASVRFTQPDKDKTTVDTVYFTLPIEMPRMSAIILSWVKYKRKSLRKLSKRMGKGENYLQQSLRSNDIRPSLLIEVSKLIEINLFEHYLALLPENIRPTEREKELQKEIENQKAEIENLKTEVKRVEAERDKYWEKIGR